MNRTEVIELIADMHRAGRTMQEIRNRLIVVLPLGLTLDEVNAAEAQFEQEAGVIRALPEPRVAADANRFAPWYTGPRDDDKFWPALTAILRDELPEEAVESVDQASTKLVSYLPPPGQRAFNSRGLVLGYVQSGKTTNFAAVIAKAADTGYRLFLVLSGVHNSLRAQTYKRLQRYLWSPNPHSWHMLSDEENDFVNPGGLNVNGLLSPQHDRRLLLVAKKQKDRLRSVNAWLAGADTSIISDLPILVIDDEADQASIDTSPIKDALIRTSINDQIMALLDKHKCTYVGYTASPFANLLIDPSVPEQLYPRDFIIDLPKPQGYFGPERIFGRERLSSDDEDWQSDGLDVLRIVPDNEVVNVRPPSGKAARASFKPDISPSLIAAIQYFIMATAARRVRDGTSEHSTMLIHTTVSAAIQLRTEEPIREFISELETAVSLNDPATLASLEDLWDAETRRLPADVANPSLTTIPFGSLASEIPGVLGDVDVKVDNYLSEDRLDYTGGPTTVIVIGGNTLSRGLTLEGLIVSYFVRAASAYDTLLQMGRWFGYRQGYEDLPRIWLTEELRSQFFDLATVEAELRDEIARYEAENITPNDLAVRIRTHHKLAITAAMKMQAAVPVQISYSGRRIQTILFDHHDHAWLTRNLVAAQSLIEETRFKHIDGGKWLASDVRHTLILDFLDRYQFHREARDLRTEPLVGYIKSQTEYGELMQWNVGIVGIGTSNAGTIDFGLNSLVNLIIRSDTTQRDYANIKTLMSREDAVMDLDIRDRIGKSPWSKQVTHRPQGVGLLLIYPISKESVPPRTHPGQQERYALNAAENVIGVAICFPDAGRKDTAQSYVAVPLPADYVEEFSPDFGDSG